MFVQQRERAEKGDWGNAPTSIFCSQTHKDTTNPSLQPSSAAIQVFAQEITNNIQSPLGAIRASIDVIQPSKARLIPAGINDKRKLIILELVCGSWVLISSMMLLCVVQTPPFSQLFQRFYIAVLWTENEFHSLSSGDFSSLSIEFSCPNFI